MQEFHIREVMLKLQGNSMNIMAVEAYELNNNSDPITGLQNYHALLWIREMGVHGTQFSIARRQCTVSFYCRKDGILFAEYVIVNGIPIFRQTIFKDIQMEIHKAYFLVDFENAESLETGNFYKLFVAFSDKQKYDRARKWYNQGFEQPQ